MVHIMTVGLTVQRFKARGSRLQDNAHQPTKPSPIHGAASTATDRVLWSDVPKNRVHPWQLPHQDWAAKLESLFQIGIEHEIA